MIFVLPAINFAGDMFRITEFSSSCLQNTDQDNLLTKPAVDSWFSRDKGLHLNESIILTTGVGTSLRRHSDFSDNKIVYSAAGFTLMTGIFKEIIDGTRKNNRFSWKDLSYDVAGVIIGIVILNIE